MVLAGERPGGSPLARELGVAAGVLADVAGQPCIARVIGALRASQRVHGGVVCGPAAAVVDAEPVLGALLDAGDFRWLAPERGPAASARAGAGAAGGYPVLLTGGDHALLEPHTVRDFCDRALARGAQPDAPDLLVGLVPHALVAEAFPASRRTVLRFADGAWCGSNLFALMNDRSSGALAFWSTVEADRKRPWRIARRLGIGALLRYLAGRLRTAEAFDTLSRLAGCRVGWIEVPDARAAVDVDSRDDWVLANRLLGGRASPPT